MPYYDFEILQDDNVIAAETSVPLDSPRAAWPKIIDLANTLDLPGSSIRVREHSGDTIILIGAAAARRFPISLFAPKGPLRPQIPARLPVDKEHFKPWPWAGRAGASQKDRADRPDRRAGRD